MTMGVTVVKAVELVATEGVAAVAEMTNNTRRDAEPPGTDHS